MKVNFLFPALLLVLTGCDDRIDKTFTEEQIIEVERDGVTNSCFDSLKPNICNFSVKLQNNTTLRAVVPFVHTMKDGSSEYQACVSLKSGDRIVVEKNEIYNTRANDKEIKNGLYKSYFWSWRIGNTTGRFI